MISRQTVDEVKKRASILEVVSDTISIKKSGSRYVALCPFHGEKSPSFFLNSEENTYHCFGCGESGNAISYIMKLKGLSFPEAVEELATKFSIPIIKETYAKGKFKEPTIQKAKLVDILKIAQDFFSANLLVNNSNEAKTALNYALERGLSLEIIKEFGIGYAPKSRNSLCRILLSRGFDESQIIASGIAKKNSRNEVVDQFWGRLMFPIFVDLKKIVAFGGRIIPPIFQGEDISNFPKYINSPETALYYKSKTLYGMPLSSPHIRSQHSVFIVEGYMDLIALYQVGVKNVVATCGTSLTEQHVEILSKIVKNVTVLFDGDNAGRTAAVRSFKIFMDSPIDVNACFLPSEDDPDSFSKKYGEDTTEKINNLERKPLFDVYIESLVKEFGGKHFSDLGPASKSSLLKELIKVLSAITNKVLLSEYYKRASFLLMIDEKLIIEQSSNKQSVNQSKNETEAVSSDSEEIESEKKIVNVEKLPKSQRELLACVMVLREEVLYPLLTDSQLTSAIDSDLLMFFDRFGIILKNAFNNNLPEADIRKQIKDLLTYFGKSWLNSWKSAYEFYSKTGTDPKGSYNGIMTTIKREQKLKLIKSLEIEMSHETDLLKKAEIGKNLLDLRRML